LGRHTSHNNARTRFIELFWTLCDGDDDDDDKEEEEVEGDKGDRHPTHLSIGIAK